MLFILSAVDYGSWFDYSKSWENVIYGDPVNPIHVVMYEDMKEVGFLKSYMNVCACVLVQVKM